MKMERKEKNKHKSQRANNLPALERFSHPRKIHGIEPKQCRTWCQPVSRPRIAQQSVIQWDATIKLGQGKSKVTAGSFGTSR
jgi:hypothetical protein